MRPAAAEKGLAAARAEKTFWPNETMWHATAAAEETQGLPTWSLGTYVP
jgi:hypothetical protein